MFGLFKKEKCFPRLKSEYKIGDKLYYYYKFPNSEPYNGRESVVTFIVEKIHFQVELMSETSFIANVQYEGGKFGTNYYGIAPSNLVAKSYEELAVKLLSSGYCLPKQE
jgi:hypothetical protein